MTATAPNPYLQTRVMTASPVQLRQMLLDGAVRHLEQGHQALERKDYEQAYTGISRCQEIVMELINGLRPDQAPELCQRLSGLYTFIYVQLVKACTDHDPALAAEMLELLRYEQETWQMLSAKLADENTAAGAAADQVAATAQDATPPLKPDEATPPNPTAGGLVGGRVSLTG